MGRSALLPNAREVLIQPHTGAEAQAPAARFDPWALGMLAVAFGWAALTIDRGWIPHDDGMLAQSAVRVLTGELPHRDFQDMYTGGLSYWHALSFTLFGIDLLAPRILLLASFAGFLALSYAIARRFVGPRPAAAAVLLGAVWSVPNYPAAMPTWYNLFLAAVAVWCVFRFVDTERRGWLVVAGVACGVSILVKIVGLYTLAAILMGLVLVEAEGRDASVPAARGADGVYVAVVATGAFVYVGMVIALVRSRLDLANAVHFVLPSAAAATLVGWRAARAPLAETSPERFARFARMKALVLAGAALPVGLFLLPYVITGSLGALFEGAFVLPLSRASFEATSANPPSLTTFAPALLPLGLVALAAAGPTFVRGGALVLLGISLSAVLVLGGRDGVYAGVWGGLRLAPTLLTIATLVGAWSVWRQGVSTPRALEAALLALVLGTFTLVRYPYSGPIYFFYQAPLLALTGAACISLATSAWRRPAGVVLVFLLLFGARWVGTADIVATAQHRYEQRSEVERLALERGGIRIPVAERADYERLAEALQGLSGGTGVMFATPDAPEAYFLSGLRNPTGFFYDFLDDPQDRTARILRTLDEADVRVIALNRTPSLSGPPPRDLVAELERRYPQATLIGRFVVRWR